MCWKFPYFKNTKVACHELFTSCISVLGLPSPGILCWLRVFYTRLDILPIIYGLVAICEDQNRSGLSWRRMEDDRLRSCTVRHQAGRLATLSMCTCQWMSLTFGLILQIWQLINLNGQLGVFYSFHGCFRCSIMYSVWHIRRVLSARNVVL